MVIDSPLQYFQQDFLSLEDYHNKKKVTIDTVKRRMFVNLRKYNLSLPDHYLNLNNEKAFSNVNSFISLFTKGLAEYSEAFLEYDKKTKLVNVKEEAFIEWQDVIDFVSPLFLISCCICNNEFYVNTIENIRNNFFTDCIIPNTRNTALISPRIILLDKLLSDNNGFCDLHLHLNGVIESDSVFETILYDTERFLPIILHKSDTPEFKQELEQIGVSLTNNEIYELVERAKQIREIFFNKCFGITNIEEQSHKSSFLHPFCSIYSEKKDFDSCTELLRYESLMYILLLKYILEKDDERTAELLHEYLLIKGFINKLLVYTKDKFGFEQFQNISKNDIREEADKNHLSKFLQLSGNSYNNFKTLELRFSPKESQEKNLEIILSVKNYWEKFIKISNNDKCSYFLLAHFIKRQRDKKHNYKILRRDLQKRAELLVTLNNNFNKSLIAGIDAAASEFDTPPEVFAPIYKYLRFNGIRHFTFHAGEDFYHILSGLRAIYETIVFCELRNGDRIGHACAAGIDISNWIRKTGEEIYIPYGEYIDDLLFAYIFISTEKITELSHLLSRLVNRIISGYQNIFKINAYITDIEQAWTLRCKDPDNLDEKDTSFSDNVKEIIHRYNQSEFIKEYTKPIKQNITEDLTLEEMTILQQKLLLFMHKKEIVIESLPTSNIRIGWHKSLSSYQLFNWYEWKKHGYSIPPIVIGTDDPGIFQTNIYNEYALIYCYMVYKLRLPRIDVINFIKELENNSETYQFRI